MKKLFLLLFLYVYSNLFAQTIPTIPEQERTRTYDVQHIKIKVSFDWNEKKVIGNVETRILPLSSEMSEFEVDAVAFHINYIRDINGNDLKYKYDGTKIKITTNKTYNSIDTIIYTVDYICQPQSGLYFVYPTELNPSLINQIWTQGEASDNKYWIPVYDYPNDKATSEVYITVDRNYKTLSNGYLDYSKKIYGTEERIDHWIMNKPHSTYLIMIAVGEFKIIEDRFNEIPVFSYVDPYTDLEEAKFSFRNTAEMGNLFNEKFQYKYPWDKYAQVVVQDFIHGGMENTTATVLNKRAIYNSSVENDYSADPLISHELAHQWWGDIITCKNWNELWLNESFATYSTALWKEKYFDKDTYDYEILIDGDNAVRVDSVIGRYPIWAGYGSVTTNIYDKGSVIINTFRHILGDKFFPVLYTFLKDNEYKNVESKDFINAINKTYNTDINSNEPAQDFKWMFDQWIWKAGNPEFYVDYLYDENTEEIVINVKQLQELDSLTPVFRVPIDIRVKSLSEDKLHRVEILDEDETFKIRSDSSPEFIVFDYGNNILDKTFFEKSFDDWKNQLYQSENAIDRIMALRGMETFLKQDESNSAGKPSITINQSEALKLFEDMLSNDNFWGVRSEAAKILGNNFILNKTSDILKSAYDIQTNSKNKREILKALGKSRDVSDYEFIIDKIKNESNNYIIAEGINALSKSLPKEMVYETVVPFMKIKSHRYVVETAIVEALDTANNTVKDERIKIALMDIAFGVDIEGRLRAKAITALKEYAKDEDVKALAKKYANFNFVIVKRALINLLAASEDKSMIQFLKNMDAETTDLELKKFLVKARKKLEDVK